MKEDEETRKGIYETIRDSGHTDRNLEGAVLIGWAAVAEWMSPDGDRWLSRLDGDSQHDSLSQWQRQGYLYNALQEEQWNANEE